MTEIPTRAQVVIIGGGVIGTSVAYHLTRLGWSDVLLLEQGQLSCGTTWHAAGLVGMLRASQSGTEIVQYSSELYARIEAEVGLSAGYKQNGGVIVARTQDRLVQLRRTAAAGAAYGLQADVIGPAEAAELWPLIATDDLVGALWLPGDGTANPTDLTLALAKGARMGGARIVERVRVLDVLTRTDGVASGGRPRVTGVRTDRGDVEAEIVVNCAGQWAKAVGALAGVNVPLHSAEHFYVVTEQIEGVVSTLPILRDPDGWLYVKEEVGGLVVGGFEPEAKAWVSPDQIPHPFEFSLLAEDWDHFSIIMESGIRRIPALGRVGIRKFYNGPESFTPDNNFILGRAPEVDGFFVGAGFNSVGIASAGGAGRALAEWIVAGEPTMDLVAVDIRRFSPSDGNNRWLRERVVEVLGMHYEVPWPHREMQRGRGLRRSPVHASLASAGAVFGARNGWERALVFAPSAAAGAAAGTAHGWGKPLWLPWSAAEQQRTHTTVSLFDQTSFSKYAVVGPDAMALLQRLCTANVDVPAGRTVYTGVLNTRGTYEADVTVTRVAEHEFLVFSSAATTHRDLDWFRRHVDPAERVTVTDVTSALATFGVMGPAARDVLTRLTDADLSDAAFPFGTSRILPMAHTQVRATRLTYVGELGWELSLPVEYAAGVHEALTEAGADLGMGPAGYHAIESLRLEKGYRAFGRELTPAYGPVHAGLTFTCDFDTDFIGREAVQRARAEGVSTRLVSVRVTDPEVMLWGGELLLVDDEPSGQVTSAAWSEELGGCVGLAYVWRSDRGIIDPAQARDRSYEIDVTGSRLPVEVSSRPFVDPEGHRIKR